MKKSGFFLVVALLLILGSCYEDGPLISFRSRDTRVIGNWKSSKVFVDGIEHEPEGGERSIEFQEDGAYLDIKGDSLSGLFINRGSWSFSEDKKELILSVHDDYSGNTYSIVWDIKKLAYKELRLLNSGSTCTTEWWLERAD